MWHAALNRNNQQQIVRHGSLWRVYHVELRQFPHNLCRFNLTEEELRAIADPWARGEWIELGERKWNRHQAKLTIVEGPQLPMGQLSMGRGWRAAQRQSEDVTERVLVQAKEALSATARASVPATPAPGSQAQEELLADPDPLGEEIDLRSVASLLGGDPARLLSAWREIAARAPGLSPSESLALAERKIASPGTKHGR